MSAGVINSSILLGLSVVVGFTSLAVQAFFWPRTQGGFFTSMFNAIGEIMREILSSFMVWNPMNPEYKSVSFTRMAVTFMLMLGLVVVVLATYDSVTSFWIYFVLYLGVGLLALPIVGHILSRIFRGISSSSNNSM